MITTAKRVSDIAPVEYAEAMRLASDEWARLLAVFDSLDEQAWAAPTDCAGWDVKDIAAHLLGMLKLQSDGGERARQLGIASQRAAANGTIRLDELTALQVSEHTELSVADLRAALHEYSQRGLAARHALPPQAQQQTYDPEIPGEGLWTLGRLFGVIHTRDPWLHRVDICRATGLALEVTAEHDGRIVEDVVAEWAAHHGQPFDLILRGNAGGHFLAGAGTEHIDLDAIEFCRVLSGREPGSGLLATRVAF